MLTDIEQVRKLILTVSHKLLGTKVRLEKGDIVVEVEPPEDDGFITVKTLDGTVGSLPASILSIE